MLDDSLQDSWEERFFSLLEEDYSEEEILLDEPMSSHTTFRIGGPARVMVEPSSLEQMKDVIRACRAAGVPLKILGCGSDLLVSDEGLNAVVLKVKDRFSRIEREGANVCAQAGATNEELARVLCEAGLSGYEFACGIPGTVGGAAIMNAGAYGSDFKSVATAVICLTPEGEVIELSAQEADWSYRHSMMDVAGYLVLAVRFTFEFAERAAIQAKMDDLQKQRCDKQPLEYGSAGSTFKRPEGYFAGKLIQDAGLRGFSIGGAQVSEKHTGFIINRADAKADDVRRLIAVVQERVFEHAGVRLEPEVRMWGF